ncbi:MAG: histidine phosphatase family protein [Gammaproteobacteria bacterium]
MSRQLLIMRHAKSDKDSGAITDFARPLNKRGLKTAPKMGRWLHDQGLQPDHVVSSPAERAKHTALLVCAELGIAPTAIHWERNIYDADLAMLLDVLAKRPQSAQRVLLVGHNPGLEDLTRYLSAAGDPSDKRLATAAIAQFEMPDDWRALAKGSGRLLAIHQPRSLFADL